MFNLIKYFIALSVFGFVISAVAIAWPKFTRSKKPEMLEMTYRLVKNTQFGRQTAKVLGVSDGYSGEPVNLETFTKDKVGSASAFIEKKIQSIIVTQAMLHLLNQYKSLESDQKQQIRNLICVPENSTPR